MSLRGPMVSSGLPSAGRKQGWSPEWGGGAQCLQQGSSKDAGK